MNSFKPLVPAVVVNDGSEFIMNRCDVKGHKTHDTVGNNNQNDLSILKNTQY
jgi:hypothetical protein